MIPNSPAHLPNSLHHDKHPMLPHLGPSAPQLSFPNNRGRKFQLMMVPPNSLTLPNLAHHCRPHICAPIAEDPYFKVSHLKMAGSEAMYPVYMSAPATTITGPPSHDDRTYDDDVNVAELLQPATSLDDFMGRVEMCELAPANFLTKINQSVMDLVQCESILQSSILKFLHSLDSASPHLTPMHKSTRDAAVGLLGASSEIMAQFQDISVGLAHLKHQQQFLWNIIKEKAGP